MNLFRCLSTLSVITCYFSNKICKFSINYGILCNQPRAHRMTEWRNIHALLHGIFISLCLQQTKRFHYVLYAVLVLRFQFRSSRQHSVILLTTGSSASARTSQRTSSRNSYSNRVGPLIMKYHIRHVLLPFSINLYGLLSIIYINFYKSLSTARLWLFRSLYRYCV